MTRLAHSAGVLADQLGKIKAEIRDLETREKEIRAKLVALGVAEAEGELFRVTVASIVRWSIDSAAVKREMGEAWWDARCKQDVSTRVNVTPRVDALLKKAA